MYKNAFRVCLFVIIFILPMAVAHAAGLGKLTLNSALGQPLNAEIDIVTTTSDEIASLKANIAAREAFAQAGINYEPNFANFKISLESRANGSPYLKLTSPLAVNDPFLNILVELSWASGRILREYAVLLDPAESNTQNIAAPSVSSTPKQAPLSDSTDVSVDKRADSKKSQASSAKNSQRTTPRPTNQQSDTYGPVVRGDTLSSIARQVLPTGVDLNQMLVALHRANRDAFIENNMNLLRVGAVLKIPEKNEVASIDKSTARAEIRMQVEDWHKYQARVAAISGQSSTQVDVRQSDQGKITTSVDRKSASAQTSAKEVLRLSSAQQLDKDGKVIDSNIADRLRMMEEDAIARNLALKEANERVAMLEKSIENMKHLLEMKDSMLAQAQVKASGAKTDAKSETQLSTTIDSSPNTHVKVNDAAQRPEKPLATQSPDVQGDLAKQHQPPIVEDEEGPSLTDQIFNNIEYIAAFAIIGLLTAWLIVRRRRNQGNDEEDEEDKRSEFSSAMRSRMASMAATQGAAEAAESFAAEREDEPSYENLHAFSESEKDNTDFDNQTVFYSKENKPLADKDNQPDRINDRIQADSAFEESKIDLGMEDESDISSEQPLARNLTEDATESETAHLVDFDLTDDAEANDLDRESKQMTSTADRTNDEKAQIEKSDEVEVEIDIPDLSLEDDSKVSTAAKDLSTVGKADNVIEFSTSGIDLSDQTPANEIDVPVIESNADKVSDELTLLELPEEVLLPGNEQSDQAQSKSKSASQSAELTLADIDLNLEDSDDAAQEDKKDETDTANKGEQWQEVETKLDLAKAYQEMDDKEGAKEMLEEVIRDGDAKQKKAARKLMKSL